METDTFNLITAWAAVGAVIFAAISALISARIGKQSAQHNNVVLEETKRHNRLSVKPHVVLSADLEVVAPGFQLRLIMRNDGAGPAIIKDVEFRLKGERVEGDRPTIPVRAIMQCYSKAPHIPHIPDFGMPLDRSALLPGAQHRFALLKFSVPYSDPVKDAALDPMTECDIIVKYTSIYEEEEYVAGMYS